MYLSVQNDFGGWKQFAPSRPPRVSCMILPKVLLRPPLDEWLVHSLCICCIPTSVMQAVLHSLPQDMQCPVAVQPASVMHAVLHSRCAVPGCCAACAQSWYIVTAVPGQVAWQRQSLLVMQRQLIRSCSLSRVGPCYMTRSRHVTPNMTMLWAK